MQASGEHSSDDHVLALESAAKISEDLKVSLRLTQESSSLQSAMSEQDSTQYHRDDNEDVYVDADEDEDVNVDADEDEDVNVDVDEDEEEFSFICEGANTPPIAAEDAFMNGQIKPSFPLFNMDLPSEPQVKKVFVEMKDDHPGVTSATSESDEIAGPYCEWSKKAAVEASPEVCKKSNSTGFSKLWRFKEFRNRSNSDGRDAFVFLNNQQTTSSSVSGEVKVNDGKGQVKKGGKTKTTTLSSHEIYMRNKAKEDDRRRSYLPYRPEVVGFFTNVNGGMSKNVHPF